MSLSRLLPALLCCLAASAAVQAEELYQAKVYKNDKGEELKYRLLLPKGYAEDGKTSYPLVLFLHGAGERGDDNAAQLKHGAREFATDASLAKYPAIVVAPQCPKGSFWTKQSSLTRGLLEEIQKTYRVDNSRLYVTGLSMGGFGTWDLITGTPDLFAAAAPVCGGGDEKLAGKIVNLPLWVFHGESDNVVKPEQSRKMIAAIEKAGGKPKYTEYPGVGHDSWTQTYANPEFMEWLFKQKKAK